MDCRHYRGDRPCGAGVPGVCPAECEPYAPMGERILVIKLAALGDVVRTLALLEGLKRQWPVSHVTWVTRPNAVAMLRNQPLIDRLLPFDAETICHLECERFDLCLSLDKEAGPAGLAMRVNARQRRGIGLSEHGTVYPLNPECAAYFRLGLDDGFKFRRNDQSYPALIYAAVGLEYRGERYRVYPDDSDRARARDFWRRAGIADSQPLIGLNTGAGSVFANKNWPAARYVRLAHTLHQRGGCRVALFGGPQERETNAWIVARSPDVIDTGCDHDPLYFAALLERADVLVTGDTMAMHVAIGADVPCVVLFGPTCPQEIDLFGRGEKLITDLPCSPCYRRVCDVSPSCMEDISVGRVLRAIERWVGASESAPSSRHRAHTPRGAGLPVLEGAP